MKDRLILFAILAGLFLLPFQLDAQLFGQNKPRYRSFDFNVLETPHYSIHYYTKNKQVLNNMAEWAEIWYGMHRDVLQDTYNLKNPIIFYNNHAEFQQTNAIYGDIGIGTGGVTEGFKNRVVLPFTMINQQNQHVLGHELVHSFQYHKILSGDSTNLQSLGNIPLWMVEGMAEYLSLGRVDPYTAMWMRDAVLNDDVPNVKKLSGYKYFPYRYGQAFWAFFSGTYGDDVIAPLFMNTAMYGIDAALAITLNTNQEDLGAMFTESLKTYYGPMLGDMKENFIGKKIISEENAGRLNVSPSVSPNGRYIIFLSDKNLFSTDLYLADARTGKIIRKVNSFLHSGNLDDLNLFESSGTWSPNSEEFAFVGFAKGQNVLVIKNPDSGATVDEIKMPDITAIAHPAWSPDGKEIAFSGMIEGQTDLFIYNLKTQKVRQLTNDIYSEVYPDYSPDGKYLVFSSDRKTFEQKKVHGRWNLHLSRINLEDNSIKDYEEIFPGADNINPAYDEKGNVYFISDRDGFRNLYRTDLKGELFQMTDLKTGISGISQYSPAISVSKSGDRVVFTHFFKSGYDIYEAKEAAFLHKAVSPDDVHYAAGTLPVVLDQNHQLVMRGIERMDEVSGPNPSTFQDRPYRGKFKLDYIDSGGFGVSAGGIGSRTGLAGGVNMIFSDILGNNQLYTTVALNGEVYDVGASVQYINQKGPLAWGINASHIPLRTGVYGYYEDTLSTDIGPLPVIVEEENILRIFQDQVSGLLQYPFSKYLRAEGSFGFNYRFFRLDRRNYFYTNDQFQQFVGESDRERIKLPGDTVIFGFRIQKVAYYNPSIALVGDNSQFGLASPINGYRFRFDFTDYFGGYKFQTATADVRFYRWMKPVSLAFRALHYSTLGPDSRAFYPILIGEQGLVHGFGYGRLNEYQEKNKINPEQLFGSKILVSNFEVRLPFTGPERLALLKSSVLFTELAWFLDGGVAFYDYKDLGNKVDNGEPEFDGPKPVFSTGFSLRVNLFGAMVIEPYIAWPLLKDSKGKIGVFLVPGW
jgi:Tol biopolymer transport system component